MREQRAEERKRRENIMGIQYEKRSAYMIIQERRKHEQIISYNNVKKVEQHIIDEEIIKDSQRGQNGHAQKRRAMQRNQEKTRE